MINIKVSGIDGKLYINASNLYVRETLEVGTPSELLPAIEELFGKGSSALYDKDGKVVRGEKGELTHFQSAIKMQAIDKIRREAGQFWSTSTTELQPGWLEKKTRSYKNN